MQAALERAVAELVLGPAVRADDPVGIAAWLERSAVGEPEASALAGELERWLVYRGLVRARLREAVELAMPRTLARLGPLFDEYFERFLSEHGPRSHYLRDVTQEFLEFAAPLAVKDARVPPWAFELGRHEALEIVVGSMREPRSSSALPELDPERGLAFGSARLVRYSFAVHRLSEDPSDRSEPLPTPTALFVYRSPDGDVRYLELTPLAAAIVERLLLGATLRGALSEATEALSVPLDTSVLEATARLLSELAERGAVLGGADPAARDADLPEASGRQKLEPSA